jgi:hypothetical protein
VHQHQWARPNVTARKHPKKMTQLPLIGGLITPMNGHYRKAKKSQFRPIRI